MNALKIDLGCGSSKKEGTIGIDLQSMPGVDYVLDIQSEPLPFPNQSVEYVHSSHFLEHVENQIHIFQEISRVCIDGAKLELWTPYTWSNSAFVFGHKSFLNEDHYLHLCVWHPDFWAQALKARWLLKEITYIIEHEALIDLYEHKISLDFALNYYQNVVREFGVFIEVHPDYKGDTLQPIKTFAVDRYSNRYPVKQKLKNNWNSLELEKACKWLSSK